mgnify:CR=1 FL=1
MQKNKRFFDAIYILIMLLVPGLLSSQVVNPEQLLVAISQQQRMPMVRIGEALLALAAWRAAGSASRRRRYPP